MPTSYPASLDAFTNPASGDPLTSPSHAAQHANANDAIEAIEAALGANLSNVPHIMAFASATAAQAGVTTEADITGLSVNVTVPAGRCLKVSVTCRVVGVNAGDRATGAIYYNGVQQGVFSEVTLDAAGGRAVQSGFIIVNNPSPGVRTIKATMTRGAGTGSITINSSVSGPAWLVVEDMGPAV